MTTLPLEDCMSAIIDYRGKTPRKTTYGIPLITAKVVKGGRIETPDEFIDEAEYDEWMRRGLPQVGDVVITTEAPLGEVAQLSESRIALAQRLILLRGKPGLLDNTYLKYLLMSEPMQGQLGSRASGTTVVGIKQSELRKVTLSLPAITEQEAIAAVLGSLDDKIEQNRRTGRKLEELARAVFKAWFVDFEPVKAKAAGATSFPGMPAATFAALPNRLTDSPLGPIPAGWEPRSLYSAAKFINGAAFKSQHFCEPSVGLPVVKIAELKSGITDQTKFSNRPDLDDRYRIDTGEVLYSWSGSPDTSLDTFIWTKGPGLLNQHIFRVVTDTEAQKTYVYYLLKHLKQELIEIARNKQTTGLGHVTVGDMQRLLLAWPTTDVIKSFHNVIGPIYALNFNILMESEKIATLRDYLLPRLLNGRVRVHSNSGTAISTRTE